MILALCIAAAVVLLGAALVYLKQTLDAGAQFVFADTNAPIPGPGLISSQFGLANLHDFQQDVPAKYGNASLIYMLAKPSLLLGSAPAVREMMMERWQEFERLGEQFAEHPIFGELLKESLFLLDDDDWKALRKQLAQGFKFNVLKAMVPHFNDASDQLATSWSELIAKSTDFATIDISPWLTKMTTEVIGVVAFGVRFNAIAAGESDYLKHVQRIMQESTNFLSYIPGFLLLPTPGNLSMRKAAKVLTDVTVGVIEARRQLLSENIDNPEFVPPNDMLQVMLGENSLSMQAVFANGIGFLIAGSETTSVALTWALWLLAKNPEMQDKARAEAQEAFAGGEMDFAKSEHLKYIGFIIKETMRLYPPAWLNVRRAAKDTVLAGVKLPAKAMITVPVMYLHRAKEYWGPTALEFRPERWDVERISAGDFQEPPRGAYVPFNVGPRDCIGARFATLEMKVVLAQLLCKFKFEEKPGFEPQFSMAETLVPKHGMELRITHV
mmetsp:Transcript_3757/g.13291  ORF Transcript_3757/g.13291 Transcript_3757/m.13291 type:complete len:497 (+) Transcript_3757:67-1557(+)